MKDAFRFLGLAAALGLAAGMVLAGIVLALAAPAYADEGYDNSRFSLRVIDR